MGKTAISASDLCKTYELGNSRVEVLKNLDLDVAKGEFVVIAGFSGSGKTTLLNIIGSIDKPTDGKIIVFDNDLTEKDEDWLADFRCNTIGFVFQTYNLVSTLTVAENVAFPMEWTRKPVDHIRKRIHELLEMAGLLNRAGHFPWQLSGGEQQRVAFARAVANDPPLMLIDEPTGNLDAKTGQNIIQILESLKADGKTVVLATHDGRMSRLADQKLSLADGKLVELNE